jgi:hypothetical protein
MELKLDPQVLPAFLKTLSELIDAGGAPGYVELMDGRTESANLLAKVHFNRPSFHSFTAENELKFAEMVEERNAPFRGRVKWARVKDSNGKGVFECSAGGETEDVIIKVDEPNVRKGDVVRINSFVFKLSRAK